MNDLQKSENYGNDMFEKIKRIDEEGREFWYARELMGALGYSKWENFNKVIQRAIEACKIAKFQ